MNSSVARSAFVAVIVGCTFSSAHANGGGDEGCTPGYWKAEKHLASWPLIGYSPDDAYCDVFGLAPCPFDGSGKGGDDGIVSLLEALRQNGGGWAALGRHSVAALLNAGAVDYPYTVPDVIDMVQAAGLLGVETVKDVLEQANEEGDCPLN